MGSLGEGRVAHVNYEFGEQTWWSDMACSLFPPQEGRVPRADEMPWWEPYYALLTRVVQWAAGGPACEIADVTADEVGRDTVRLDVQLEGTEPGMTVRAVCVGLGGRSF